MRIGRSGFVVVLAALLIACAGAPAGTERTRTFESTRYGYALELPAGWYVRDEGAGEWGPGELSYVGAGTDAFEEDYPGRGPGSPDYPGVTYGLYVSSAEVPVAAELAGWVALLGETVRRTSSCSEEPDPQPVTVGGEPAGTLVYDRAACAGDHHTVVLGVIHAGRGYALTWLAKAGEADARRAVLDEVLASFRFTR